MCENTCDGDPLPGQAEPAALIKSVVNVVTFVFFPHRRNHIYIKLDLRYRGSVHCLNKREGR